MKQSHKTIGKLLAVGTFIYVHRAAIAAILSDVDALLQAQRRPAGSGRRTFASAKPPIFGRA